MKDSNSLCWLHTFVNRRSLIVPCGCFRSVDVVVIIYLVRSF